VAAPVPGRGRVPAGAGRAHPKPVSVFAEIVGWTQTSPGAATGSAAVPVHPAPSTTSFPAITTCRLSTGAGAGIGKVTPIRRSGP
jgi:hypothetical protein